MRNKSLLFYILIIFAPVFTIGHLLDNGRMMIPEFTVPYFSGAALLHADEGWQFNLNEVDSLNALLSLQDKKEVRDKINEFRFSTEKIHARSYSLNQTGYLYIVWFAGKVFWWTGDIAALKLFQLFIHGLISLLTLMLITGKRDRLIFYFLYAINPFILYYAIYPFYYFWEVVPSAIFLFFYLNKRNIPFALLLFTAALLAFLFHVRSTVLLISLFSLFLASRDHILFKKVTLILTYALLVLWMRPEETHKHPGHVMYTSLGAYPNNYVANFSDTISWNQFRNIEKTDYSYSSSPGLYDAEIFFRESSWCLSEYKKIIKEQPLIIIRNASLNFFQSFSFGYFRGSIMLSYFSSFAGLVLFILLLYHKKYKITLAIMASSITFSLYLAPLPIYMYGAYIIILIGFLEVLSTFFPSKT